MRQPETQTDVNSNMMEAKPKTNGKKIVHICGQHDHNSDPNKRGEVSFDTSPGPFSTRPITHHMNLLAIQKNHNPTPSIVIEQHSLLAYERMATGPVNICTLIEKTHTRAK